MNVKFAGGELLLPLSVINRGPLAPRGVTFQHFEKTPPGFSDPVKQEIKDREAESYGMYANYPLMGLSIFFFT